MESTNNKSSQLGELQADSPIHGGGLSGLSIRRPVFTTMIMVGLVVLGTFGFRRLSIDRFPDVDFPVVTVQTLYPGASPETIEREISRRMEEAFNTIEGIDEITSQSLESISLVTVQFELDRNIDVAAQDVRSKMETIRRDLPAGIDPPIVQKLDPAAVPIISLALYAENMPLVEITSFADETIRRRLEAVAGVGEVRISGGLEREIRVFIEPEKLQSYNISIQEVMAALSRQNVEVPAGRIERAITEQLVRVDGRLAEPRDFEEIIVANRKGEPIRLGQVAQILDASEEERSIAQLNSQRAVGIDILKISGANTVDVADQVAIAVEQMQPILPAGVNLQVVRDNAVTIRHSVEDVIFELLLGALLTVLVVMLFLNDWKATVITSLALPVSVISTFILMNALGFTLNIVTLLALALSIGILIDDAIVVIENIVRHRELGQDHFTAAGHGTREIILAVLATTLSIVAVFVPVAFMGGLVGQFFYEFGLTVAWAVMVSLFVSFTLTPMLSAWWGIDPHIHESGKGNIITRAIGAFNRQFDKLIGVYRIVIEWALRHRKSTLVIATASFVGAILLFPLIGGDFFPPNDESQFIILFETPEGSNLPYTHSKADQIISELRALDEVDYVYTTIGAGPIGTVRTGEIYVKLVSPAERQMSQRNVMALARETLSPLYGLSLTVVEAIGVEGPQAPLQVELRGPELDVLQRLSSQLMEQMQTIDGIVDLNSSMGDPRPEYRIEINRDVANDLGLDVGMIAASMRPLLAGETVTTWEDPAGEERDVVVQLASSSRTSTEDLSALPVLLPRSGNATVPLGQLADIERDAALTQVDRKRLQRVAVISASNSPGLSIAEASSSILDRAASLEFPAGYTISMGGQTERLQETTGYVIEAMLLAIILIFLILASQFESFMQPLAIMLSLPLSLIGVLLALLITDDTLNMMSMIGVIMLMGLVTKNAILLVDNANEQRKVFGRDKFSALIEAGTIRFRPIIMTTLAMIFGMLPVALALGEGSGFRAPMARAVIGGLITSSLLTLIVVPVAYTYLDSIGSWIKHKIVSPDREHEIEEEQARSGLKPEPVWGDETNTK